MSVQLVCPRGHRWELASESGAGSSLAHFSCPVCGSMVEAPAMPGAEGSLHGATSLWQAQADSSLIGPEGREAGAASVQDVGAVTETKTFTPKPTHKPLADLAQVKVTGYEILRELGRGGMGVVYQARQIGLGRLVALKMIIAGVHADPEERARFRSEAEAIARMQHPNLVQIYEVGEQEGRPFFSLEYVDGGDLDDKLKGKPQPAQESARMIATLARAMHYAHQRGVVHRDLKPGNVLLTADGTPKITDFGLAKRMDSGGQTQTGAIMGTPSYMAPEQAAGRIKEIGPHSDIYALGAMLYEMLTGRPPFTAETGWDTIVQVVSHDPLPPSRLQPHMPKDLETICLKCLEKDPRKRYADAAAFADDLDRYLQQEPILARPIGPFERGVKWVKRRPAVSALLAFSAAAVVALLASGIVYHFRLERLADENRQRMVRLCAASGARHLDEGDWLGALVWFTESLRLDQDSAERADVHRTRLASVLRQCPKLVQLLFHDGPIHHASFSADGLHVVTASEDRTARVWDVATGKPLAPSLLHKGSVLQAWFSPDEQRLLTACADGTARIWETFTGQPLTVPMKHGQQLAYASWSPNGRLVLTAGTEKEAKLWDSATGKQLGAFAHDQTVNHAAFSPDGSRVITASDDRTARVWDATTFKQAMPPLEHEGKVNFAIFSPDGQRALTASTDQTARLWRVDGKSSPEQRPLAILKHNDNVRWAAYSPDGRRVLTASNDDTARIWNADSGEPLTSPLRHGSDVRRYASFSPDGQWALTASDDNTARLWNGKNGKNGQIGAPFTTNLIHHGTVHAAAFSPDGLHLITVSDDNTARIWDLIAGSLLVSTNKSVDSAKGESVQTSPDGRWELRTEGSQALVKEKASGRVIPLKHDKLVTAASFSPASDRVVTASADQTARVWTTATGKPVAMPLRHASIVWQAAFSPDGTRVVTAGGDNTARIWDARTGALLAEPLKHLGSVNHASFSADGLCVATASNDGTARVWDARTGAPISPSLKHPRAVLEATFSDDRQVTTRAGDGFDRVWELPREDRSLEVLEHLAQLLAGSAIDPKGGYMPLDVDQLKSLWEELHAKHTEFSATTREKVQAWRQRRQESLETATHD